MLIQMRVINTIPRLIALLLAAALTGCASTDLNPYRGAQRDWPTASGAFVKTTIAHRRLAVPMYCGYPSQHYIVLGSLTLRNLDNDSDMSNAEDAFESAARYAKKIGGDALLLAGGRSKFGTTTDAGDFGYPESEGGVLLVIRFGTDNRPTPTPANWGKY